MTTETPSTLLCASTHEHGPHVWIFEDRGPRRCPGLALYSSPEAYDSARAPFNYVPTPFLLPDVATPEPTPEPVREPEPVQSAPEPPPVVVETSYYSGSSSSSSDSGSSSSSDSYSSSSDSSSSGGSDY